MSGGHFQYEQYKLLMIADEIEQLMLDNNSEEKNEWGELVGHHFSEETMAEFKKAWVMLKLAHVYAQRIDWLVSGDDGEDSFHRRLKKDMDALCL